MPPLSIMIKPASSLCNLDCRYCFYHDVAENREEKNLGIMQAETAENLIKSALKFADGYSIAFAFQGGEPLIAGKDYFSNFVSLVDRYNIKKSEIFYSIQTNGLLINDEWAEFFTENKFLVGLSLDGDREANKHRVDLSGQSRFFATLSAAKTLEKAKTEFNILSVLTGENAKRIDTIYSFLKSKGFRYLQFIPCLRPFGSDEESPLYMTNEEYEYFLIHAFNAYVKDFVRNDYVSIRQFDNYVRLYLGDRAEQCGMCGHCTHQFVAEGNGNIYPCDFYCTDEWLLGNINKTDLEIMANSQKAKDFIRGSLAVPEECKKCPYFPLCRAGGCKRSREDRNYCQAYKGFFKACLPLFRMFRK
ncbi:MAG: SPASM domain-containing protein [Ruminococcaceae bacterium]|nr:SPASM domain-containing protein [Oscillospiraceae bacterium]